MLYKSIYIKNGEEYISYNYYKCDKCGVLMEESFPIFKIKNEELCSECAFRKGIIDGNEFASLNGICFPCRVGINENTQEIEITTNKFSWEFKKSDYRSNPLYKEWRINVFKRDNFICQICGKVGGRLEAHHIKKFKEYKELRYEINNGVTLCEKCHKEHHRKERIKK